VPHPPLGGGSSRYPARCARRPGRVLCASLDTSLCKACGASRPPRAAARARTGRRPAARPRPRRPRARARRPAATPTPARPAAGAPGARPWPAAGRPAARRAGTRRRPARTAAPAAAAEQALAVRHSLLCMVQGGQLLLGLFFWEHGRSGTVYGASSCPCAGAVLQVRQVRLPPMCGLFHLTCTSEHRLGRRRRLDGAGEQRGATWRTSSWRAPRASGVVAAAPRSSGSRRVSQSAASGASSSPRQAGPGRTCVGGRY